MNRLALLGGPKCVTSDAGDMFRWTVVTDAMEQGVLRVLRDGSMHGTEITKEFEQRFAEWYGVKYALAHNTGTQAIQAAMYGIGVGRGDQVIAPSLTYWATCLQVLSLGASVIFCDIRPDTLCIDPDDIEHRITSRTKAILVVHYLGYPADMDRIMAIARQHGVKVLEDVSHAHGSLYKGRMTGTIGDVAGMSLMSRKAFAIGEGGMLLTNDSDVHDRALVFGHYARHDEIENDEIRSLSGIPWGGYKNRMSQMSSVVGLEQIRKYPSEMAEIDKAMNYFWDQLEGVPGIRAHRPPRGSGLSMGGWYASHGLYVPEELEGLSVSRFCEAVRSEGVTVCVPGANLPLHLHPLFSEIDVYGDGKPTQSAFAPDGLDLRQSAVRLPVAESLSERCFYVPWFKRYRKDIIDEYCAAFRKVVSNYGELLAGDNQKKTNGMWGLSQKRSDSTVRDRTTSVPVVGGAKT